MASVTAMETVLTILVQCPKFNRLGHSQRSPTASAYLYPTITQSLILLSNPTFPLSSLWRRFRESAAYCSSPWQIPWLSFPTMTHTTILSPPTSSLTSATIFPIRRSSIYPTMRSFPTPPLISPNRITIHIFQTL